MEAREAGQFLPILEHTSLLLFPPQRHCFPPSLQDLGQCSVAVAQWGGLEAESPHTHTKGCTQRHNSSSPGGQDDRNISSPAHALSPALVLHITH